MFFPDSLGSDFLRAIQPILESTEPEAKRAERIWGTLSWLQGAVLSQLLVARIGSKVFAGPFRGMQLINDIMDRHFAPFLLGTYEWELHGAIEEAIAKNYKYIVNIGSSFGYYAIGMARRIPGAMVYAHDSSPLAREQCKKMAIANNVQDRVTIGSIFTPEDFERYAGSETLVIMDVDGAEQTLLDPQKTPALRDMDIIVEIHDYLTPNLSTSLPMRFASTHQVRVLPNAAFTFPLEKVMGPDYVPDHFDGLLATWEGRVGPTPYGIFNKKKT